MISILLAAILFAALYAKKDILVLKQQLIWINLLSVIGIFSIYGALYIAYSPTGNRTVDGVHGRYFLPFVIPAIMLLACYLPLEVKIRPRIAAYMFVVVSVAGLLISSIYYYAATY